MVGITGQRNEMDETLISQIALSSGSQSRAMKGLSTHGRMTFTANNNNNNPSNYIIADARPYFNSLMNYATGKGSENEKIYKDTTIVFLGIPNIHVMRRLVGFISLCSDHIPSFFNSIFILSFNSSTIHLFIHFFYDCLYYL